jgi:hypothetical protein
LAPNRASAEVAIDVFAEKYGAKYDKAVECLTKDRETMLAFYDFPAEHWDHLRTTNPIESGRRVFFSFGVHMVILLLLHKLRSNRALHRHVSKRFGAMGVGYFITSNPCVS